MAQGGGYVLLFSKTLLLDYSYCCLNHFSCFLSIHCISTFAFLYCIYHHPWPEFFLSYKTETQCPLNNVYYFFSTKIKDTDALLFICINLTVLSTLNYYILPLLLHLDYFTESCLRSLSMLQHVLEFPDFYRKIIFCRNHIPHLIDMSPINGNLHFSIFQLLGYLYEHIAQISLRGLDYSYL